MTDTAAIRLHRTASDNPDFLALVVRLDEYLRIMDGDDHAFYAALNTVDAIHHVVVAYRNDETIGCGAMKPFTEGVMEIKRMFVDPAHRGQEIAGAILAELERWAHEEAYTGFVLETGIKQTAAIRLYKKTGFVPVPNYGQYVGVDQSVCFAKAVAFPRLLPKSPISTGIECFSPGSCQRNGLL
ncbi:MAG: GNAT family N-acetyltransferase [Armatimonadetes bacterium]|nr:GNAT family N-acetyltransferase [Armatimonadota bacterium]